MIIYKLTDRVCEIEADLDRLDAVIEENGGEITDEISAMMEALESEKKELMKEVVEKPEQYMEWYKNVSYDAANLKAAKAEIDRKKKSTERKLEWISSLLAEAMNINGKETLKEKDGIFTASFRKSEATEYDEAVVMAPYEEKINQLKASLPGYISLDTKIMVTPLKGMDTLPEGFSKVQHRKLNIR